MNINCDQAAPGEGGRDEPALGRVLRDAGGRGREAGVCGFGAGPTTAAPWRRALRSGCAARAGSSTSARASPRLRWPKTGWHALPISRHR
ncbi:MAG: hypothetical protein MZW92_49365 [Comamonadaceae bacterium]|nr:hypothetical protein [Comamonadaceae bacterium]